jgi:hypothetical protein
LIEALGTSLSVIVPIAWLSSSVLFTAFERFTWKVSVFSATVSPMIWMLSVPHLHPVAESAIVPVDAT